MKSTRRFGIEIEATNVNADTLTNALNGAGIATVNRHNAYGTVGTDHSVWQVTYDGSVRGHRGFELVSPILSGNAGMETVRRVAAVLVECGAKVNASCGLHVHVEAVDLSVEALKRLVALYLRFESEIDTLHPSSRRHNHFCASNLRDVTTGDADLAVATHVAPLESVGAVRRLFGNCRYHKLNLESLVKHGTVEFRQAAGTVNATKMTTWIGFCLGFVESAKRSKDVVSKSQFSFSKLLGRVEPEFRPMLAARRREVAANEARANTRRANEERRRGVEREARRAFYAQPYNGERRTYTAILDEMMQAAGLAVRMVCANLI